MAKLRFGNEKERRIAVNTIAAFVINGLSLLVSFGLTPAYIAYFSNNLSLGVWYTLLSVGTWLLNIDFGIGNGLRNLMMRPLIQHDDQEAKSYVSTAYAMGFALLALCGLIAFLAPLAPLSELFSIEAAVLPPQALAQGVQIVLLGIGVQMLLRLVTSVLHALQVSAVINFLALLSNFGLLVYLQAYSGGLVAERFISLAVVYGVMTNLPILIAAVVLCVRKQTAWSRPSLRSVSVSKGRGILSLGMRFMWVQIAYLFLTSLSEILITQFAGAGYVVDYQAYNKLYMLIGSLFALLMMPVWSAITNAWEEGKTVWIQQTYRRYANATVLAIALQFLMVPITPLLLRLWLKQEVPGNTWVALCFAMKGSIYIYNNYLSSFANGIGKLKVQAVTMTIGLMIEVPLAWLLCRLGMGWLGVVVASVVAFIPYLIAQPLWFRQWFADNVV